MDFKFKKVEVQLPNGQIADATAAVWDSRKTVLLLLEFESIILYV